MNRNIVVLTIVITTFVVLFINAQTPVSEEKSSVNATIMENDITFLNWAEVTSGSMASHILKIGNASKVNDYKSLEKHGVYLQRDADISLNQSKQLEVSSGVKPILEDIQESLENYKLVGKYVEMSGKNLDNESLSTAIYYAEQADNYVKNASVKIQQHVYQ